MERKKKASLSLKNRKSKELQAFEKSYDQDESLGIHCSFENNSSPGPEIDIPCTQLVSYDRILEGVVAFVEVRSNTENRFEGISKQMEMLGAKVVKKFTPEVTHVIFKDGKKTTRERALKKGIHLVSVLWVESCRQSEKRVSEDLFPVMAPGEAVTPLIGRLKRTKSMQPKAFEEDVQNSADRGERRRKRKLQAEKLTPSAVIFCLETQDPYSPAAVTSPAITPHMVPDTPCHTLDVSPLSNKALACDVESPQERPKPIEPIKFSEDETDQSPDSSEDIPSSIRKLKKRLLSISTPTRSPSTTQNEPRRTTDAQPEKTPKDVLLTGSEQGKKRKRQDLKKLSQCEGIKESVPKQRKKVKCGAQAEGDAVDDKKPKMEAACLEKEEWNNGSDSVNGANVMKNILENVNGKTKQANVPKKKKAQAKTSKKFLEENFSNQNGEGKDSESDSVVSAADGNNKTPSSNSCSAPSREKFSKTAKLVGQGDQGEDFGDTNTTEDNEERPIQENKDKTRLGTVKKGHNLKPLNGVSVKRQANQEKLVGQDKHASQEKAVSREKLACQVNGYEEEGKKLSDNYEGKYGNKNRKGKQNEGETRSEGSEEEDNNETCTEEEERHCEGKENRAVKKQRTKLVKKVKPKRSVVMTSMHFNEQDIVLSVVRKLGGFFIEDRVSPSTSHVIAGSPRRTLNVLMAIAKGCWLVSPMWMMKSLEVGYWVDEEPYELSDAFPAAQLCRLERVSAGSGYRQELFVDCPQMYVSENCSPPSDSLMALIRLCGGKVSTSVRKASICIGSMTRRTQAVNITEQWLLDCITQHAVLPFTNYALNSPAKRRRETSPSY